MGVSSPSSESRLLYQFPLWNEKQAQSLSNLNAFRVAAAYSPRVKAWATIGRKGLTDSEV